MMRYTGFRSLTHITPLKYERGNAVEYGRIIQGNEKNGILARKKKI
jgi:hypothetical protein